MAIQMMLCSGCCLMHGNTDDAVFRAWLDAWQYRKCFVQGVA